MAPNNYFIIIDSANSSVSLNMNNTGIKTQQQEI